MTKIVKRMQDYTLDEFRHYCSINGLDENKYLPYYPNWIISDHEALLMKFLNQIGPALMVTINGTVGLDGKVFHTNIKTLSLLEALDATITPDVQDFAVLSFKEGVYYISTTHARGHNLFKISLN